MLYQKYAGLNVETVYSELSTQKGGLSKSEASRRLGLYGKNQTSSDAISWVSILLRQFKSPFSYLLLGAFAITLLLGEQFDSLMIILFVAINTILGFIQEFRSEKTVSLLNSYLERKTKVIRDNEAVIIPSSEIVPGDIVVLEPGDIVPCDLRLSECFSISIDESVLTGESMSVYKDNEVLSSVSELYDARNISFGGTTVLSGEGRGIAIATGKDTVYADIAKLTSGVTRESLFEKEIAKFSKFILWMVIVTLGLIIVANLLLHKEVALYEILFFSIALAVSVIPEALPVVTTFSLSIGAARLTKKHVVVKRLSAIEDLGGIEVLCSDKTGTLTQNNLSIEDVIPYADFSKKELVTFASLASQYTKTNRNKGNRAFEEAIYNSLDEESKRALTSYERIAEFPFDPERKRASSILSFKNKKYLIVRGAPEEVFSLLAAKQKSDIDTLKSHINRKGENGVRCLAIAMRELPHNYATNLSDLEKELTLVGCISFVDPIKDTTQKAVDDARKLGVQVKIITGDSAEVAGAVAFETGLIEVKNEVLEGADFEKMTQEEKHNAVTKYHVFARISPSQKYSIIELLKERYQVGFLGEGINDAPALKSANVGLVVDDASDIAREAADVVLLDKSLSVIIDGIREGRSVFANTNKYITATLSSNFGNFFAIAIVSLIIDFLPMLPLQILLVNLLSDFPMISIATDSVDSESIDTPSKYSIRNFAFIALLLGLVSTVFDILFFSFFKSGTPQYLQTHWFIGSILTELVFIYSIRTKGPFWKAVRPPLLIVLLTVLGVIMAITIPYTELGKTYFDFVNPTSQTLFVILMLTASYFIVTELVKNLYYRYTK